MLKEMVQIEGTITTVSPVHIGSGKMKGTFHPTLDHIPGRTLRGMLGYYLYKNCDSLKSPLPGKSLFEATGINEQSDLNKIHILFRNAYFEKDSTRFGQTVCAPLCLQWCKRCDHLVDKNVGICKNTVNNISCGHEGKKRGGFISWKSFETGNFLSKTASTTIITKCPIIRKTHTGPGKDDRITPYHIEGLSENQKFGFRMLVGEQFVDSIKESLINAPVFSGIGGFRSRGYGTVRFDIPGEPRRVEDLIGTRTEKIKAQFKGDNSGVFTLVANAPMILRKAMADGKPGSSVGFDEVFLQRANECLTFIRQLTGISSGKVSYAGDTPAVSLGRGFARGWSLEKNNTVDEIIPCISAGSTVEVKADPEAIAVLEMFGIGDMTHCGYGQVYCLPPKEVSAI